ncbi:MAG: hypothetical protein D6712_01950 [Chloroflexi bacterium]|nr:MAG: hypothetical protein D6712_01950 [Chloroflexota bacterium]
MNGIILQLEQAGYRVSIDDKAPYYEGMLTLLGGVEGIELLRDAAQVRLLSHAQVRKGRAYTNRELFQLSGGNPHNLEHTLLQLVKRHIWLRGYRLRCPNCTLEYWYRPQELSDPLTCVGCYRPFIAPLEQPFAYQLNPLFAEGLRQGALTVLLALYLSYQQNAAVQWAFGLLLQGEYQTDIDLMVFDGERLYVIECKDNVADEVALQAQIERGLIIAGQLPNAEYVFATLGDPPPIVEQLPLKVWSAKQLLSHSI